MDTVGSEVVRLELTASKIENLLKRLWVNKHTESVIGGKPALIKGLEDVSLITSIKVPLECQAFCDSYIITLIRTYLHDARAQEVLLVAFGLLEDFDAIAEQEINRRRREYARRATKNTLRLTAWDDIAKCVKNIEISSIKTLSEEIYNKLNEKEQKGHLNLGEEVARKLVEDFPDGIPEQYPLPKPKFIPNYVPQHAKLASTKPRSFAHTVTKDQDTQDELDDSTEAISDNRQKETTAGVKNPESPQSSKIETISTGEPPQTLHQEKDDAVPSSEKGNDYVTESNSNDSHDISIQIINIHTNSTQDDPPIPDLIEPASPSIESPDPEPPPQPPYYLDDGDMPPISDRIKQTFINVRRWYHGQNQVVKNKIRLAVVVAIVVVPVVFSLSKIVPKIISYIGSDGVQTSSLSDISSADPISPETRFPVTDEDMPGIINEARGSIEVLTESGEYDIEAIKDLILRRIANNPIYGDMVARGFQDADSFMQSKIAEGHPQFADFAAESSAIPGENDPTTFIPDMSHWLMKVSSQVSTTDNYKKYASFLCAMLENPLLEIRVDNFDSTSHWSISGDAEGVSAHAELVARNSSQPAIIFESIRGDNQLGYQVAFFLKDGSFATCNPWVKAVRSNENPGKGRPSYTIEEVENGALGDKIVFNSISDGVLGDEKNFVSARPEDNLEGYEGNDITVENGKEYVVRLYVHNNNPKGEEAIAENVRVAFALPELNTYSKDHQINGFITSSNATPDEYWDYINFHSDTCFKLTYVPGSARINNNGFANKDTYEESKTLSNSIVKTLDDPDGVLIGYEQFADGKIPGGFQYDQVVYIRVKAEYPDYRLQQQVRLAGDKIWKYNVEANVGDKVEFQIEYRNIDDEGRVQENIFINDVLPDGLRYVPGSSVLYNYDHQQGAAIMDDSLPAGGISIGNYTANSNAYVRFTAEVIDNNLEPGSNALVNWVKCTVNDTALSDYAVVMVNKE